MSQKTNVRKTISFREAIFFITVLLLCLAFLIYCKTDEKERFANIYENGTIVKTVDLTKDETFSLKDKPRVIFEVKSGAIAFTSSDCPDKVCVNAGFISTKGQKAVCLPNKIVLSIENSKESDSGEYEIDAISQ